MTARPSRSAFGGRAPLLALAAAILATGSTIAAAVPAAAQVPRALLEREPTVAVTSHEGTFGGARVPYRAIVEEHLLEGPDGASDASLVTIAYVRDDVDDPSERPVVFAFNGGPGASSSPLHMDGLGPRLRTSDGTVENPHSILDAADLVFIDPVGTGFSRPWTTEIGEERYWNTSGDAASVKRAIDLWLEKHDRLASPRYLAGESYGTTRIGVLLENHEEADFDGVILVALADRGETCDLMRQVVQLPTMATSAWYHERVPRAGRNVEEVYREAVEFARTEYLPALVQGAGLPDAERRRVAERTSGMIGLPADVVEDADLRLSKDDWMLNVLRDRGLRTGMLDTRVTAERDTTRTGGLADPALGGGRLEIGTEMLAPAIVPGTSEAERATRLEERELSTLERYLREDLGFETLETYRSLNLDINGAWEHEEIRGTAASLAAAMEARPEMRLFWTAGFYDLTTPAYAAEFAFDQAGVPADRTTAAIVAGPHAVFSEEENRRELGATLRGWLATGEEER